MQRRLLVLLLIVLPFFAIHPVSGEFHYDLHFSSRFLAVEGDTGAAAAVEPGFAAARLNLLFYGEITESTEGLIELEGRSGGEAEVELARLFIVKKDFLPRADLRLGRFVLNFGDQAKRRSENARVQDNNLIGNGLVDLAVPQTGVELSGIYARTGWSFALTEGQGESDFTEGTKTAVSGKLWAKLFPRVGAAVSYYRVDNDSGLHTNFTAKLPAAEVYSEVLGSAAELPPGEAASVEAWQVDLLFDFLAAGSGGGELYLNAGRQELESGEIDYGTAELRYSFSPAFWVAGRTGRLDHSEVGRIERNQLGIGYRLDANSLLKLETVRQSSRQRRVEYQFDGLSVEFSTGW